MITFRDIPRRDHFVILLLHVNDPYEYVPTVTVIWRDELLLLNIYTRHYVFGIYVECFINVGYP